ncbi:MAG: hypothetical protein HYV63_28120 [Candidatus Schekmanbacteria bacterium]|nr:hypothetical protein [Candidatus Schekmanbacteria bacterium]
MANAEGTASVLVRCDGDWAMGLGHVVRCVALARELVDAYQWRCAFAVREGEAGRALVERAGFATEPMRPGESEETWLEAITERVSPDAVIVDAVRDVPERLVALWRRRRAVLATIDTPIRARLGAELAFFHSERAAAALDWSGFSGTVVAGWEWVVLRRAFRLPAPAPRDEPPRLLIAMGGSDPAGLTARAGAAMELVACPVTLSVLLGPAFAERAAIEAGLQRGRHPYEVHVAADDPAPIMGQCALGLVSYGVTALELAALGVPALHLCLSAAHLQASEDLCAAGGSLCLGLAERVSPAALAGAVETLLADGARRAGMRAVALQLGLGGGAAAVARRLAGAVEQRKRSAKIGSVPPER